MKITFEQLLNEVAKAKPDWSIHSAAHYDGSDATMGQLDNGCIDVWRFGDGDRRAHKMKVTALMTYISIACTLLPRIEAALRNLRDCDTLDKDSMAEINTILTELNNIELQSESD